MALGVWHAWLGEEDLGIYDENKFSLNDAFTIKASCGLNVGVFTAGIKAMDPLVLQTLVWWLRFKKGVVASALSANDGISLKPDAYGHGRAVVLFPKLPLLKSSRGPSAGRPLKRASRVQQTQKSFSTFVGVVPIRWAAALFR